MNIENQHVIVFGAGLVGSLLSIYLAQRGCKVDVYERRPDLRLTGGGEGRSINLALSDRGWRALEEVGIADDIRAIGIPMAGRMIHDEQGKQHFQPYGEAGQAIYSVSRGKLNERMVTLAESYPNVRIHFDQRCQQVDFDKQSALVENTRTGEVQTIQADVLFGADGANSMVRAAMQKTDRFDYEQRFIEHGYKELTIPALPNGDWAMDKNALHIWPRGQFMMIALPNTDGTFTCTLFFPYEGEVSFAALQTPADVSRFFEATFADLVPLIPTLAEDFFRNPTASLMTVRCYPWVRNRTALIGDAAHAIVPFYGQGMNAGFEDCRILNGLLDGADDWATVLSIFQQSRKPNGDAILDLAMQNFVEMRDLVADPQFVLRKKIEAKLHELYPDWLPLYTMVTFSHIPYSEALAVGRAQDAVMARLMAVPDIEKRWTDEAYLRSVFEGVR